MDGTDDRGAALKMKRRHTNTLPDRRTSRQTKKQTATQTDVQTDKPYTLRQTSSQAKRQTATQTIRYRDVQEHILTSTNKKTNKHTP